MNSYKRIYSLLTETRASKKTQAAKKRFEAGQKIFGKTKKFTPGGGRIPGGGTAPLPAQANYSGKVRMRDRMEADKKAAEKRRRKNK